MSRSFVLFFFELGPLNGTFQTVSLESPTLGAPTRIRPLSAGDLFFLTLILFLSLSLCIYIYIYIYTHIFQLRQQPKPLSAGDWPGRPGCGRPPDNRGRPLARAATRTWQSDLSDFRHGSIYLYDIIFHFNILYYVRRIIIDHTKNEPNWK